MLRDCAHRNCGAYALTASHATADESPGRCIDDIPGTYIFDGKLAARGYALNKMCYSFNDAANRAAFVLDEEAYCAKFGLTAEQREAVRRRDVLALLTAGGNVYYLAKFLGIFGLGVQDIGAQQTGMTLDAFKAKLKAAAN